MSKKNTTITRKEEINQFPPFTAEHGNEAVIIRNINGEITNTIPYDKIAGEVRYIKDSYTLKHTLLWDSCFSPEELGLWIPKGECVNCACLMKKGIRPVECDSCSINDKKDNDPSLVKLAKDNKLENISSETLMQVIEFLLDVDQVFRVTKCNSVKNEYTIEI